MATHHGLLAERDFRLLLFSQFAAQAADGLAQATFADILVLEPLTQGTPEKILGLFALTLLPYSIIAPFLGVFVDRWPRRALLAWTNVGRAALLVTIPLWAPLMSGDTPLYLATLVLLGVGRLFLVTKGAVLPVLIHEHRLLQGNSLSSGGGMIAALAGGVVGIASVGLLRFERSFVIAGVVYGIAALLATRISAPLAHPHPPDHSMVEHFRHLATELGDGIKEIWSRAHARLALIGIFLLRVFVMFVVITVILLIKDQFPPAEGERFARLSTAALALGAAGLGAFAGAGTAPLLGRSLRNAGLITVGFSVSTVGIILLGGIVNVFAIVGLTFLGGYGAFVSKVAVDAQIQESLPDEFRGRAFALYDIVYNVASVVAGGAMVLFFGTIPTRLNLVATGLVALVATIALAGAMSRAGMALLVPRAQEQRA